MSVSEILPPLGRIYTFVKMNVYFFSSFSVLYFLLILSTKTDQPKHRSRTNIQACLYTTSVRIHNFCDVYLKFSSLWHYPDQVTLPRSQSKTSILRCMFRYMTPCWRNWTQDTVKQHKVDIPFCFAWSFLRLISLSVLLDKVDIPFCFAWSFLPICSCVRRRSPLTRDSCSLSFHLLPDVWWLWHGLTGPRQWG